MQTHTTFINKQDSLTNILDFIETNKSLYNKFENSLCYSFDYNSKEFKAQETDTYHFFVDLLKPTNNFEKTFIKLFIKTLYQTEIVSGYSSLFVYNYFIELIKQKSKKIDHNKTDSIEDLWNTKYKSLFEQCSVPITNKEQIYNSLSNMASNKDLLAAVYEAIMLSGLEGKIFVESTYNKQPNYIVELKSGYMFKNIEPFTFMLDQATKIWSKRQVKTLIVDGIIEEVSEIDHLLNAAYEHKQPFVIISQGFSEEIAATCKINNDNGNTDIQLLKLSADVFNVNVINDISVVCGTTPVSSLQGEMVSMVKWEELPTVDRLTISLKETNIENIKTQFLVLSHMKNLMEKKKEAIRNTPELDEDLNQIYDSRLKSLASNAVYIFLPNVSSNMELNSLKISIDNLLRLTKSLLQFGLIDINKVIDVLSSMNNKDDIYSKALLNTLIHLKNKKEQKNKQQIMPLLSIALGFYSVTKNVDLIINSSGFVVLD